MGIQAGATNLVGSLSGVRRTLDNNDIDPAFSGNTSKWLPNVGTGLYLSNDRGYIGVSVPNLVQNELRTYTGNEDTLKKARQERHYFLMMGFVVPLGSSLALKPSVLVKATRDAAAFDFNLTYGFVIELLLGLLGELIIKSLIHLSQIKMVMPLLVCSKFKQVTSSV
jgi:hypothetical protein